MNMLWHMKGMHGRVSPAIPPQLNALLMSCIYLVFSLSFSLSLSLSLRHSLPLPSSCSPRSTCRLLPFSLSKSPVLSFLILPFSLSLARSPSLSSPLALSLALSLSLSPPLDASGRGDAAAMFGICSGVSPLSRYDSPNTLDTSGPMEFLRQVVRIGIPGSGMVRVQILERF